MSAKTMHELKEMLCKELDDIVRKGSISHTDLETVHKLTDTIKNIHKIDGMEEQGYSYGMGDWMANGKYYNDGMNSRRSYDGSYNDNTTSGRMHYVRGHYSRDGGDMLTERIEEMVNDNRLSTDEKSTLRRAMDILKQ